MKPVEHHDIVAALRSLGVVSGDLLLAHTSLGSFGRVTGGAEAVSRALIDAVSPGGSVFVPTFTFGELPWDPGGSTRSLTGAVTEAFRQLPGVIRSAHPTHAVAGFGPAAGELLAGHDRVHPFAPDSPLWRLWKRNAWVLLVGCGLESNSMVHVAEELVQVPQLARTRVARLLQADGGTRDTIVRRPGCSNAFNIVDRPLRTGGAIRETRIGEAPVMLMRAQDVVQVSADLLRRDPAALLCPAGTCPVCDDARRMNSPAPPPPLFEIPPENRTYVHLQCGRKTTVDGEEFLGLCNPFTGLLGVSTFCVPCRKQAPLNDFMWADTGENLAEYRRRVLRSIPRGQRRRTRLVRALLLIIPPLVAFIVTRALLSRGAIVIPALAAVGGVVVGVIGAGIQMVADKGDFTVYR
jgi:aminoglycoside 3-N-acetyltransferase